MLLDALQELRDAGAEAIEITGRAGVRVVADDLVRGADGGRRRGCVGRTASTLHVAVRFQVIGDPRTLAAALDIPGGVLGRAAARATRRAW